MTIFYNAATGGFYLSDVHASIPDGSVEVSEAEYEALRCGGLTNIVADAKGRPILSDGMPRSESEQAELVRRQRDRLLQATDRYVLPDFPQSKAAREQWMKYREALRQISAQPGFPAQVDWPASPAT